MPGTLRQAGDSQGNKSSSVNQQAADNVLKSKALSMEQQDESRKLARAAERELQQRLSKELESAKLNALLVQESWRKIMRTIKVSYGVQTRRNSYAYSVSNSFLLSFSLSE